MNNSWEERISNYSQSTTLNKSSFSSLNCKKNRELTKSKKFNDHSSNKDNNMFLDYYDVINDLSMMKNLLDKVRINKNKENKEFYLKDDNFRRSPHEFDSSKMAFYTEMRKLRQGIISAVNQADKYYNQNLSKSAIITDLKQYSFKNIGLYS